MTPENEYIIDMSRFVALGDSVTAGYKDGALFYEGQLNAYPKLIAQQCKTSMFFKQALMDPDSVGIGSLGNSRLTLKQGSNAQSFILTYLAPTGDTDAFTKNIYAQGPFNNLGVPGTKVTTLLAPGYGNKNNGTGNYNPYFSRIVSDPEKASLLSEALAHDPTFFSLFIGNNDVLAYALYGGTVDSITPLLGAPGMGFEASLNFIISSLMANGAKGVISNLPDISCIPFFNTVPYNGLLLDLSYADLLNTRYQSVGIKFHEGYNPFLVEDLTIPTGNRLMEKGEFVLHDIFLDLNKYNYLKGLNPIPKKYYLSISQVKQIQTAIISCNDIIKKIAIEKNIAFVDTDHLLKTMKVDRVYDPSSSNIRYKTGGVFSLDGLHINSLGHALLANEFIKAINKRYGSHIQKIKLTRFREKY